MSDSKFRFKKGVIMANQFYSNSQSYTEIEQNVLDYIASYQTDLKDLTIQKLAYETFYFKINNF